MATVTISSGETELTVPTNDTGAAMVVEALSQAFSQSGGAWMALDHSTGANAASDPTKASLRWFPAATTTVLVEFTDGPIPPELIDLPGFLK